MRVRLTEVPFLVVLLVVAAGLAAVALDAWRSGSQLVGVGLLLAAGLRLTLPSRSAGLLVVRSRAFDATVLLVLGFGMVVLALSIPAQT